MIIRGKVTRQKSRLRGTPGGMVLENGFGSDTLELPWMNNDRGKSCTAPGVDRGRVWWSPHLNRPVIRWADRNGRQDCLVHNANWAGEGAGEVTQLHGCTSVGRGYGDIARPDGVKQWGIVHSVATLEELIKSLRDEDDPNEPTVGPDGFISGYHELEVEYSWAEGCEPVDAYTTEP